MRPASLYLIWAERNRNGVGGITRSHSVPWARGIGDNQAEETTRPISAVTVIGGSLA